MRPSFLFAAAVVVSSAFHPALAEEPAQQEICAGFARHRAAIAGVARQLTNEPDTDRKKELENQYAEAIRAAREELSSRDGAGKQNFEAFAGTVEGLVQRSDDARLVINLNCPDVPLFFLADFSDSAADAALLADPPPKNRRILTPLTPFKDTLAKLTKGDGVTLDGIFRPFVIGNIKTITSAEDFQLMISIDEGWILLPVRVAKLQKR
jgi:hypothetical protein